MYKSPVLLAPGIGIIICSLDSFQPHWAQAVCIQIFWKHRRDFSQHCLVQPGSFSYHHLVDIFSWDTLWSITLNAYLCHNSSN